MSVSRSSARRGTVEPVAALVAVFAVCVGVGLHAGILDDARPVTDRDVAGPTLERVHDAVSDPSVVDPTAVERAHRAAPDGYLTNVTLRASGRRWTSGPTPPAGADAASRRVAVRLAPGRSRPGTLRVEVWT
ncbi:MAG: hypothetical protein ABEJ22_06380 [Haloferacaceae archaeon]